MNKNDHMGYWSLKYRLLEAGDNCDVSTKENKKRLH